MEVGGLAYAYVCDVMMVATPCDRQSHLQQTEMVDE